MSALVLCGCDFRDGFGPALVNKERSFLFFLGSEVV